MFSKVPIFIHVWLRDEDCDQAALSRVSVYEQLLNKVDSREITTLNILCRNVLSLAQLLDRDEAREVSL